MKYKGINYDVGTTTINGELSRKVFDLEVVTKEIAIIKNELHCNAIRISGLSIDRIAEASEIALKMGLTVWFSPSFTHHDRNSMLDHIVQSAGAAEKLRTIYPDLVFVTGSELSLFTKGFIKGETDDDRMKNLFSPVSQFKNMLGIKRNYNKQLNEFLADAVHEIKKVFHGQVTYASGSWEKVDWKIFDLAGVDHYRSSYNKLTYVKELKSYKKTERPVCITAFGCCAYKGADDKGSMGWSIVDWRKDISVLNGTYVRDEEVQSRYLLELLHHFESENVFAAFVFTFVSYHYEYDDNPQYDLDMASYGIVRSMKHTGNEYYQGLQWIPKKAFFDLGQYYKDH